MSTRRRLGWLAVLALAALAVALLAAAPNLLWLSRSSLRVVNLGPNEVRDVRAVVCGQTLALGDLAPGQARFRLLPRCGDASLEVRVGSGDTARETCRIYVEGAMYHVDAWVGEALPEDCEYAAAPFGTLLVGKVW